MKETENKSPYPILSVNGRKGQSGEWFQNPPKSPLIRGTWRSSFLFPSRGGGTFCEAKGGGAWVGGLISRQNPPKSPLIIGTWRKAFTLVELIIVITILAILATIAFISFQWYTSRSRDANRASTAKNIETWLELFQTKSGVYPIQSTWGTISLWATGVTVQWDLDLSIARVINLNEVPKDPKTGDPYNYISDTKGRGWKVLYYLENTPDYAFLSQSFAESEARTPIVKGQWPWVLLDTGSQMVTKNVDLFGATQSWETFTILVNDTTKVTGSGLELGGGFQMFAEKWGRLEAPKSCPTGFIAVPWNAEFMQPWFCVAKYEMGYADTDTPDSCNTQYPNACTANEDWNTVRYNTGKTLLSQPWLYPVANISQTQAIAECQRIWKHLITNNEWMTIARNIEANPVNWSWGVVGINHISNGVSYSPLWCGEQTTKLIYSWSLTLTRDWATKTWPWGNTSCDTKRQLKLSNGEIIRDLAGNVWEHVNKANTKDWGNFNVWMTKFDEVSNNWNGTYEWHKTGWSATTIPEEMRKKYGPSKSMYTHTTNWVWNIYGWYITTNNNVFLRGGSVNGADTGVFTLTLSPLSSYQHIHVGFRCAF